MGRVIAEFAQRAEALGYDRLVSGEHVQDGNPPIPRLLSLPVLAAAAVATLPPEEQKAAAVAGKDELKQAAKRVREAQRKPRAKTAAQAGEGAAPDSSDPSVAADQAAELQALHQRVAELTAENEALRKQVSNLLSQLVG